MRVYDRALSAAELQPLLTDEGATPPGLPAPDPGTPGGGTPAPGGTAPSAPRVTAITAAAPVVAGRPAVVNAALTGAVDHLDWDLNADGKTDATCPGSQTTLAFRPSALAGSSSARAAAAFGATATVRAVSAAGTTTFTQTLAAARAPAIASAALGRVADALAKKPVLACGLAKDIVQAAFTREPFPLTDRGSSFAELLQDRCQQQTLIPVGVMRVSGCLTPIRSAAQIPAAERGSLNPLLDLGKVQSRADIIAGKDAPAGTFVEQALDFADAYISRQPVIVNGVTWTPQGSGRIVIFPQVDRIYSSNATMSVAGINLAKPNVDPARPRAFSLNTRGTNGFGRIPLGTFQRQDGGTRSLAGFDLTGDVDVTLVAGGGSQLKATLQLPSFLDIAGVDTYKPITISVTPDGQPTLDGLTIGPLDANLGPVGVEDLKLTYTGATREWRGTGALCIEIACLDAREVPGRAPPGGIVIRDGELQRFYADLTFPDPGITLFPGVQLNRVGAGLGLNPTRLLGGIGVTAAGIFQIDGALVLAFPTSAAPYTLTREEAGSAFPAEFYNRKYTTFTMAVGADAYLKVPYIDTRVRLGGAYLLYNAPAYVAFGGGIDADFFDIVSISGGANGEFNLANGKFNLAGRRPRLRGGHHLRGRRRLRVERRRRRVRQRRHLPRRHQHRRRRAVQPLRRLHLAVRRVPLDALRRAQRVRCLRRAGRQAAGGEARRRGSAAGDPARGEDGCAARARHHAGRQDARQPRQAGDQLERVGADPALRADQGDRHRHHRSQAGHVRHRGASRLAADHREHAGGRSAEGGASPPTSSPTRRRPATGGRCATTIRRRKDQRVRFVDIGPTGSRELGTISGGGRGTLKFTAVPGTGVHRIEAQFQLAGLEAERITVARFRPPSTTLAAALRASPFAVAAASSP